MIITHSNNAHIPVLDGIRGMAIILVLIFHLFSNHLPIAKIGWVGVDLFFVLSGFLITGILLRSKKRSAYFKNFFSRRVLRIFPLYYLVLISFMLIVPALNFTSYINNSKYLINNQVYFWLYTQNWIASFDNNWPIGNPLSHFWSLAVEEQFYLFWPFLMYYFKDKNLKWVCIIIILCSIIFRNILVFGGFSWVSAYVNTFARLDTLAIGSLLAILINYNRELVESNSKSVMIFSGFVLLCTVVVSRSAGFANPAIQSFGYTIIAIFFSSIITFSLVSGSFFEILFSNKIMRFFGKYAYGLYVYHVIFLRVFAKSINTKYFSIIGNQLYADYFTSFSILFASIIISFASFQLFENRILYFKKYFNSAN
jgi:peptidoglycan/LPS O-acetylase OafA/YrhL